MEKTSLLSERQGHFFRIICPHPAAVPCVVAVVVAVVGVAVAADY